MSERSQQPGRGPRLFTVDEANALLPTLEPILRRMQTRMQEVDRARRRLTELTPAMRGNGHGAETSTLEARLEELATELTADLRRVSEQGVEIKDLDQGLIDFPSLREGRVVYLCWRLGEGKLAFWHELDGGFAGRQPL